MGIDQGERRRQIKVDSKGSNSSKHPIAAIEKRVIDSESFANLPPTSVGVLLLYARNLERNRNGWVFVAPIDAIKHGIDRKTFYRSLKTLTAHGFLYPTRRGGNGKCGTYALTWLPLCKDTKGLYVDNFQPCAYRNWAPKQKSRSGKKSPSRGQKSPLDPTLEDIIPPSLGDKITHIEC
jgi:hypothetical protein